MKIHSKFPIVALAAVSVITTTSAATIYSDSLLGDTVLNGSTVDTSAAFAGGTSGAAWTAATSINETATGAALPTNTMAFLPITITAGNIYTLQATMTNNGAGWGALGFSDSSTTDGAWHTTNTKYAWGLLRPTGDLNPNAFFGGANTDNPPGWTSADIGTQTMTITLDTTNAAWSTYASINGVNSNTFTYTINPVDITHVGFGVQTASSQVSNFSLTAVPEPSVALLGGLGVLALLRRRRA